MTIANITVSFTTTTCAACGCHFGMDVAFYRARKEDGKTFYCPAGHSLHYGDNEADRLRRELADEKARSRSIASSRDYAFSELRETEAKLTQKKRLYTRTRNELTKVKTRVAAGVCPDCNRSFQNVARHMATKHPKD